MRRKETGYHGRFRGKEKGETGDLPPPLTWSTCRRWVLLHVEAFDLLPAGPLELLDQLHGLFDLLGDLGVLQELGGLQVASSGQVVPEVAGGGFGAEYFRVSPWVCFADSTAASSKT